MVLVAVGLGSNLGDRRGHLDHARQRLGQILSHFTCSDYVETEPVGVGPQPRYLNAAATGRTAVTPRGLLDALLLLEAERHRRRVAPGAARTLDLDLLLYGDLVLMEPGLVVPHPRFRDRRFVLEPLARIAPAMVDPVTGKTVAELLCALDRNLAAGSGR